MDDQDQTSNTDTSTDEDAVGTYIIPQAALYFESAKKTQWSWVAVAVMIGNYNKTGPVVNGKITKWTQNEVITRCIGTANLNVPGSPDLSMNVAMVYSALNTSNASLGQSLPAIRNAIRTNAPVVVGYGTPQGDQLGNPRYFVVYGYNGPDLWYFGDPSRNTVTQGAPLPIPTGKNVVTKVVYSRTPKLTMK